MYIYLYIIQLHFDRYIYTVHPKEDRKTLLFLLHFSLTFAMLFENVDKLSFLMYIAKKC